MEYDTPQDSRNYVLEFISPFIGRVLRLVELTLPKDERNPS